MIKFSSAAKRTPAGNLVCVQIHRDDAPVYAAKGWSVGDVYWSESRGFSPVRVFADPLARQAIAEQGFTPSEPNGRSDKYMRDHPTATSCEMF